MIPQSYIDYYGDQTRWFIGIVTDINDPYGLGRVKVRIFGIHSENVNDIPDKDLPWAQTVVPITEGGSSGTGATVGIQVKAQVFGMFLDGKSSQLPLVLGSIPKFEVPSSSTAQTAAQTSLPPPTTQPVETNDPDSLYLKGNTNIERAYNFFVSEEGGKYAPHHTAAIIGNFLQESGDSKTGTFDIRPTKVSNPKLPGKGSRGIAQWNPQGGKPDSRLAELYRFAESLGTPWDSLYTQVQFVKYELDTLGWVGRDPLIATKDVDKATEVFCFKYERPTPIYAHLDTRQKYARRILKEFR